MTVRSLLMLAATVGLGLASSAFAEQPAATKSPVNNQKLADDVAARIGKSGTAYGASVAIKVESGVVVLTGDVFSVKQAELIVQQALLVPGVAKVETYLALKTDGDIRPVQASEPMAIVPPASIPGSSMPQEPIPLGMGGMPSFDGTGPKMPPFAWPTYAPYNNVSRVAYPSAYPYNAFPFIGPYYPFPKVPLGWRSVKLEWSDGHWYLGRLSTPHDYWRVRFW